MVQAPELDLKCRPQRSNIAALVLRRQVDDDLHEDPRDDVLLCLPLREPPERMKRLFIAFCVALLTLSRTAAAWNSAGHMMVAAVAYEKLTPAAHARVTSLLKLNPDYPKWVSRASRAESDEVAFVMAATWPDEIKSEREYENDGDRPSGADAGRNIGYADHRSEERRVGKEC